MAEILILTQFFRQQGGRPLEEFLEDFPGAFLMARHQKLPPLIVPLPKDPSFRLTVGSDEECDLDFDADPTLDPVHLTITYHPGFRGWTVEDPGSSFGTHVDGERVSSGRTTLLSDRSQIKPGGGLTELQFYLAETLYGRMNKAGITRSLRRKKATRPAMRSRPAAQAASAPTPPAAPPARAARPAAAPAPPSADEGDATPPVAAARPPAAAPAPPPADEGDATPPVAAARPPAAAPGGEATIEVEASDEDDATPVAGQGRP